MDLFTLKLFYIASVNKLDIRQTIFKREKMGRINREK